MHPYGRRLLALFAGFAGTCLGLACAADPGDPLKSEGGAGTSSSSGSPLPTGSSGSSSGSSSGTPFGSSSSSGVGAASSSSSGAPTGSSSGGPSSSSSGSSGGSSSGGIVDASPPPPIIPEGGASCVTAACPLKIQYMATGTNANTIGPDVNVVNEGGSAVDLSTVKIHYYFTADGDTSLAFNCDYSGYVNTNMTGLSSANVSGTFVPMGANATPYADTYLEIGFSSGSLPAGGTAAVNFRIHDSSFATNYNQSNDWSFFSNAGGAAGYVDAQYITAYVAGTLAWGIEPGTIAPGGGARPDGGDAGADATVRDANAGDATAPDAGHPADGGGG